MWFFLVSLPIYPIVHVVMLTKEAVYCARGVTIDYMKADTICKRKHMMRYCRVTECVWAWHICICSHMTSICNNMVFCGIWDWVRSEVIAWGTAGCNLLPFTIFNFHQKQCLEAMYCYRASVTRIWNKIMKTVLLKIQLRHWTSSSQLSLPY